MGEFAEKKVLITGGGKGIGKGIALEFARRGAKVAIGCNANPGMAQDTLKELSAMTEAVLIPSDVGTPEGCKHLVDEAVRAFGGLDVLVNNAAIQTQYSFLEADSAVLKQVMNVNLRAAMLMLKYAHPYLKDAGAGRAILISSVHGKRPTDFDAAYAISKGGMEMLCREAAIAFAGDGITVNIVAPGAVMIESKTGNPKPMTILRVKREKYFSKHPMGRITVPEDVAQIVCFLSESGASQISGTTIRIDGCSMLL